MLLFKIILNKHNYI